MALRGDGRAGQVLGAPGVGLGGVGERVEAGVGDVLGRLREHEDRVVDRQRRRARLVEPDPLVGRVVRRGVGDDVERGGLRPGADRRVDRDVRRVGELLRDIGPLELIDVAAVMRRYHPRSLRAVRGGAAPNRHEAIALLIRKELVGVHDVVVLGIGLDLVVDGDGDTLGLELALDLVDDPGALEARGHEQDVLEAHPRRRRRRELMRSHANQAARLLPMNEDRKLLRPRQVHEVLPFARRGPNRSPSDLRSPPKLLRGGAPHRPCARRRDSHSAVAAWRAVGSVQRGRGPPRRNSRTNL